MATSAISLFVRNSPLVDLTSSGRSTFWAEQEADRARAKASLFEENREWCEQYRCKYGWLGAYIMKAVDLLIKYAMTIIYSLLDTLMSLLVSTIGPFVEIAEKILVFACCIAVLIANMAFSTSLLNLWTVCCAESFLLLLIDFIFAICGAIVKLYKKMVRLYFKLLKLYDWLAASCECEVLEAMKTGDKQKMIDAAKAKHGNEYDNYVVVDKLPDTVDSKTFYIILKPKQNAVPVPEIFKMHVENTVNAYNRWPYGADGYCPARTLSYGVAAVTWMAYVSLLVWNWLSSSNMQKGDDGGYTKEEMESMRAYCKDKMPPRLWRYVEECL